MVGVDGGGGISILKEPQKDSARIYTQHGMSPRFMGVPGCAPFGNATPGLSVHERQSRDTPTRTITISNVGWCTAFTPTYARDI